MSKSDVLEIAILPSVESSLSILEIVILPSCDFFSGLPCCDLLFSFCAKVFGDLVADPEKLLMVTVAAALQEIGYELQVHA